MNIGWQVDEDGEKLTNLRFADDVLLLGRSLSQVVAMLEEIYVEAQPCGLHLYPKKNHNLLWENGRKCEEQII